MIMINLEMPTDCYSCKVRKLLGCRIANESGWLNNRRDDKCPLKEQEAQRDYEASIEMAEYCERYEQTYNPEDGSM